MGKRFVLVGMGACYQVVSRTVCGQFLFEDREKEMFVRIMRKQAAFCGIEIVAYSVMSNHFHQTLRIPYEEEISDRELMRRYRKLYSDHVPFSSKSPEELSLILKAGGRQADEQRRKLKARMGSLPVFMRELKQRFTVWYNHTHDNKGTIWSKPYDSLLVEDDSRPLAMASAYIDLNAVRADMVNDPVEYRHCNYSEAMGGGEEARNGLMSIYGQSWSQSVSAYRMLLYEKGRKPKGVEGKDRGVILADICEAILSDQGKVSIGEAIHCRIRYMNAGMVLGSEAFVEKIFEQNRSRFGKKRKRGGHDFRGIETNGIKVMRDLRVDVVS